MVSAGAVTGVDSEVAPPQGTPEPFQRCPCFSCMFRQHVRWCASRFECDGGQEWQFGLDRSGPGGTWKHGRRKSSW